MGRGVTWRGGVEVAVPVFFRRAGVVHVWAVLYRYYGWRFTVAVVELRRVRWVHWWRWRT